MKDAIARQKKHIVSSNPVTPGYRIQMVPFPSAMLIGHLRQVAASQCTWSTNCLPHAATPTASS